LDRSLALDYALGAMSVTPERQIRDALGAFDLARYVEQISEVGRAQWPAEQRETAVSLYREVCAFRSSQPLISRPLDDELELARRVLYPEWCIATGMPQYRAYINADVLNWFLHTTVRTAYQDVWRRCVLAIKIILDDLQRSEAEALRDVAHRRAGFDEAAVRDRLDRVEDLRSIFDEEIPESVSLTRGPPAGWAEYLPRKSQSLALVHLTALPLTLEHDERFFLRIIHLSECCFFAILTASLASAERLKRNQVGVAAECLRVALPFAEFLTPLFQALKTMSPEHFHRFRDATGAASAIQSRTYQLMQVSLMGVNPATIDTVTEFEGLQDLRICDQPDFVSLATLACKHNVTLSPHHAAWTEILCALRKELYKWRTMHVGIVRKYLAGLPGTGGTTAVEYLNRSLRDPVDDASARESGDRPPCPAHMPRANPGDNDNVTTEHGLEPPREIHAIFATTA
jgi:tryptophan 2,3-dioxygenase